MDRMHELDAHAMERELNAEEICYRSHHLPSFPCNNSYMAADEGRWRLIGRAARTDTTFE